MVPDPIMLFAPLTAGTITGAGLTFAGGNFFAAYMDQLIKNKIKTPLSPSPGSGGFLPPEIMFSTIRETLMTVSIFLTSGILLFFYAITDSTNLIHLAYILFFIATLLFFHTCLLEYKLYSIFDKI